MTISLPIMIEPIFEEDLMQSRAWDEPIYFIVFASPFLYCIFFISNHTKICFVSWKGKLIRSLLDQLLLEVQSFYVPIERVFLFSYKQEKKLQNYIFKGFNMLCMEHKIKGTYFNFKKSRFQLLSKRWFSSIRFEPYMNRKGTMYKYMDEN